MWHVIITAAFPAMYKVVLGGHRFNDNRTSNYYRDQKLVELEANRRNDKCGK